MHEFNEAVSIMLVGMITVMLILILIIVIGNTIIRFSNKYIPEEKASGRNSNAVPVPPDSIYKAITLAINKATKGQGKVTSIKKIQ
jgi:oxaloacetate decarboxylase gamma subunit